MDSKIRIIIDQAIPFIEGVLEPYADVIYKEGRAISREDAMNADALIIRTRTKCDASLLEGTPVKFIATATIGMDHIDLPYCNEKGIVARNSAGCNAGGVMNYVFSALYGVAARKAIRLEGGKLGIVGVGNVGRSLLTDRYREEILGERESLAEYLNRWEDRNHVPSEYQQILKEKLVEAREAALG